MYKFAPADTQEIVVFGAARPRYTPESVEHWIGFIQSQKIQRICCLLEQDCLRRYPIDLLETYREKFGRESLLWQPLADFQLPPSSSLIKQIIPWLICSEQNQEKVVVHCSGGIGRTGIVLASWLVARRGFTNREAISAVKQNLRNPDEAIIAALLRFRNPYTVRRQLDNLLNDCRHAFEQC